MNYTIFYEPEGYSIDLPKLMGRNAAGASFLTGLFKYAESSEFDCLVSSEDSGNQFSKLLTAHRLGGKADWFTSASMGSLRRSGGLFYPGPAIRASAFHRLSTCNHHSGWSICGITHTTSSAGAMDSIADWVTAPVQPWDAVICTSSAVKQNVEVVLQTQVDALRERLGITKIVLPQLPVIPLGVHCTDFKYSEKQRAKAREQLGADDTTLVVLYMGRLAFHAKAHPLAMYQALEAAAAVTKKKVILVECGWHASDYISNAFHDAAKLISPSVTVVTLDGRVAENRDTAWSGADILCSLSDNIQETFGIVPVEAMAAGLPVVVTDWDGYKDTVRDGVDGFRIPTLAPKPGLAGDLAHRHALGLDTYDLYCGHSSSLVAVHGQKLTQAFIELFQSPDLRKKMGDAGRLRATQNYDWSKIIPRYEDLWQEQNRIRLAATAGYERRIDSPVKSQAVTVWPARLDPTIAFANYSTYHLGPSTQLTMTEQTAALAAARLDQYKGLDMVNYASFVFPTEDEISSVFSAAEAVMPNGCAAQELLHDIQPDRKPYVLRGLAWLCKLGLFRFS